MTGGKDGEAKFAQPAQHAPQPAHLGQRRHPNRRWKSAGDATPCNRGSLNAATIAELARLTVFEGDHGSGFVRVNRGKGSRIDCGCAARPTSASSFGVFFDNCACQWLNHDPIPPFPFPSHTPPKQSAWQRGRDGHAQKQGNERMNLSATKVHPRKSTVRSLGPASIRRVRRFFSPSLPRSPRPPHSPTAFRVLTVSGPARAKANS